MPARRFPADVLAEIAATKYFRLRAGDVHRFTAVWVVVVDGRVLVRPWNDREDGWYRTFLAEKHGAIKVGDGELPVRAVRVRSAALQQAMDAAYAAKYTTKANAQYVTGFATTARRATTLELLPDS
ncbi:MAG TPA: DUF2255 family protein [Gemmatimonadaceae bacterium]|nr:DUF2255 family protein [Gemmatimonadaceae bacterium]